MCDPCGHSLPELGTVKVTYEPYIDLETGKPVPERYERVEHHVSAHADVNIGVYESTETRWIAEWRKVRTICKGSIPTS